MKPIVPIGTSEPRAIYPINFRPSRLRFDAGNGELGVGVIKAPQNACRIDGFCVIEGDAEGLDNTYAWLVDANGNASTSNSYSESAGAVKYLIGIAKFNESKTVNSASTGMQAQFRVTRGLNVDFTSVSPVTVNFGLNEFKVVTTITTD